MAKDNSSARYRLERLETLFCAALDRPAGERAEFLDSECRGDAGLLRDIERLLRRHDDASSFMANPIWGSEISIPRPESLRVEPDFIPGDRVGHYRMVRQIGVGGMGAVWLAERDDAQYTQQVALKIIKRGMDTDDILHRFQIERQVMAELDHPNIARLLDGGATPDGRPYLVMEYVAGTRIDEYCKKRGISDFSRLQLFIKVCSAVQHAHEHLVIHRDLKPGNILVTNDGKPKLLDFGISKVLDSADAGVTADATAPHQLIFTPRYASPEQIRGERFTTASDVYSLGVVLYELLTGMNPYGLSDPTRQQIERAVLEAQPARPSSIRRDLDSDIDAILFKALAKEPTQRYPTADALKEDIKRRLNSDVVLAHPPGTLYQIRKLIGRHRLAFAFAAVVVLLVLSFAIVAGGLAFRLGQQRETAQRRFDETRGLARTLIYDLHDAVAPVHGALPARELIVDTGLTYLDALSNEAGDDVSLQLECADGYFRVAELQGTPSGPSLGQTMRAIDTCRQGLQIVDGLLEVYEADDDIRLRAARGSRLMGDLLGASGESDIAIEQYDHAIARLEQMRLNKPTDRDLIVELEKTHFNLAAFHERADRYDAAEEHFGVVADLIDRRIEAGGDLQDCRIKRANTLAALGHVRVQRGAINEAVGPLEEAIEVLQGAVALHPEQGNPQRSLALARMDLGRVWLANGDTDSARTAFEFAIEDCERLITGDPTDVAAQRDLSVAHRLLAKLLETSGDYEGSLRHFEETIRIRRGIVELDPTAQMSKRDLAVALDGAGSVLRKIGRTGEALDKHGAAKTIFDKMFASDPENPRNARSVAIAAYYLGNLYRDIANEDAQTPTTRLEYLQLANESYQESKQIMQRLSDAGLLRDDEAGIINMLTGEIAASRAELTRLDD